MRENPLAERSFRIPFDRVSADDVVPAVREALAQAVRELDALVADSDERTFENTILALDALVERVNRPFGIVKHLISVVSSDALRAAYNEVLPEYSAFMAGLSSHAGLWEVVKRYAASSAAQELKGVRRRHLDKTVREFLRAGADLSADDRASVEALRVELSKLSARFSENVLDGTNAYAMVITDEAELDGLPEGARRRAREDAAANGVEGYRFTLQYPSVLPFMKFAKARDRRRALLQAFNDRGATGPHDNRPLLRRILQARRSLANLLGYPDFVEYQLEDRMIGDGASAMEFERELAGRTRPYFRAEVEALERHARSHLGIAKLEPWDTAFVSESLRRERFDFDDEALRPYFALPSVLAGLFEIANRLFGVRIERTHGVPVWHADVETYDMFDEDGLAVGSFYADWFPRSSKRGGAWMNWLILGGPTATGFDPHLGVITTNFTPPSGDEPALLTHQEVGTVFHEFGHLLHLMLSKVEVPQRAMDVAWDFIELPSQIMENWTWEREALDLFARHHRSGERIPDELYRRLLESRTFLEGSAQMGQLSLGTVDLALHSRYDPELGGDPIAFAQHVMEPFAVRPEFAHTNMLASFAHVFAGGYAAGYYSYKWSEVLEADAFTRFRDEGIFDRSTGRAFVENILSRGDSDEAAVLFRSFMGRDPDTEALIERNLGPLPVGAVEDGRTGT